jgi:hypothetical protein
MARAEPGSAYSDLRLLAEDVAVLVGDVSSSLGYRLSHRPLAVEESKNWDVSLKSNCVCEGEMVEVVIEFVD